MSQVIKMKDALDITGAKADTIYKEYCAVTKEPKTLEDLNASGGFTVHQIRVIRRDYSLMLSESKKEEK